MRNAQTTGTPFKQVVNEALQAGLRSMASPGPQPYRLRPAALGQPRAGTHLDKALRLADALEDEAIAEKLEQRR